MNITIHVPNKLGSRLTSLQDRDDFVVEALEREFARQKDIDRLDRLVQKVSNRASEQGLTEEKLEQILDDV